MTGGIEEKPAAGTLRRFCMLQASYWAFQAAFMGYITSYMLQSGMSSSRLSYAVAGNLMMCFLGSLFWGRRIDREQANRKYFLVGIAGVFITAMIVYLFVRRQNLLLFLYPLLGFMNGFIATNLDAWILAVFPGKAGISGKTRSFATSSYAVTMLIFGTVITRLGYRVIAVAGASFLLITMLIALRQPETPGRRSGQRTANRSPDIAETYASENGSAKNRRGRWTGLLSSRVYVLLVAAAFLTGLTVNPLNNMKPVIMRSVGGGVNVLGLDSFIGCLMQLPFLLSAGKMKRIPQRIRLMIGILIPLFYALLIMYAKNPAMVIFGGLFNNMSFGILYPVFREITEEHVERGLRNTAHSVVDVVYGSFAGTLALAYTGMIIDKAGTTGMAMICVLTQIAAIFVAAAFYCTAGEKHGSKAYQRGNKEGAAE